MTQARTTVQVEIALAGYNTINFALVRVTAPQVTGAGVMGCWGDGVLG